MSNVPERRRNYLARGGPAVVIATTSAAVLGLIAFIAKPLTITVGDIDVTGIVIGAPLVNIRVLSEDPAVPTPVHASDWGTATGSTEAAFRDTGGEYGAWDGMEGELTELDNVEKPEVVTVASRGITSPGFANCFMLVPVAGVGGGQGSGRVTLDIPDVPVGESRNFRFYFARLYPVEPLPRISWHAADLDNSGGSPLISLAQVSFQEDGDFSIYALDNAEASVEPVDGGSRAYFSLAHFYGFEYRFDRTSSTTMDLTHAWVYDDDGTELYSPSTYYRDPAGGGGYDADPISVTPATFNDTQMTLGDWRMGANGFPEELPPGGPFNEWTGDPWGCWGGVAVVDNVTQIGPWNGSY